MRLLVYLIIAMSFMFGQIAAATPREDAEYIVKRILLESNRASNVQYIAGRYVHFLTKELAKHSVKVVDPNRFAEMLPENVVEPWLKRWQELYVDNLLEAYTPAQLVQFAAGAKEMMEKTGTSQTVDPKDIGKYLGVSMAITVPMLGAMGSVIDEIKQSMPKLNEAPYLADILETDGIFSFPNRIWRKDLIAKIRSGD